MQAAKAHGVSCNQISHGKKTYDDDELPDVGVRDDLLENIFVGLKQTNCLVKELIAVRDWFTATPTSKLNIDMRCMCNVFEVAIVFVDDSCPLQLRYSAGENGYQTIDSLHELFKPLMYPLLFPFGEDGWGARLLHL